MIAVFVVGGAMGVAHPLDAAWLPRPHSAQVSWMEEVVGGVDREMVLEKGGSYHRDL